MSLIRREFPAPPRRVQLATALMAVVTAILAPGEAALAGTNGRIAFASTRDENAEIYMMNTDGTGQIRVTNNAASDASPTWQSGVDTDGDSVVDTSDNCTLVPNATQLDANGDGYDNICDADLNNSGTVTTADFGLLRARLGTVPGPSGLHP